MRNFIWSSLFVFAICSEDNVSAKPFFNSANNLISGATNSGNQTIGGIGNLATHAGNAIQNLLNASQKAKVQIHNANQQVKAGKEIVKEMTDKKNKAEKSSDSDTQKKQVMQLEKHKVQLMSQNAQRINALKSQLQQEEIKQKAQIQAIDQQISSLKSSINKSGNREKRQKKADQILAILKSKQSSKQNKLF